MANDMVRDIVFYWLAGKYSVRCFVASAFGYQEVDGIYRRTVQPVLREFGITSLRVDRVEHNEDIDDKIFSLLDSSDICIADLTFARPSVYYEAGYAFGQGKPVIYIVRRDHFKAQPDDHHGIHRVHFDLQMKNIIWWNAPDESFRNRLRKRVKHVISPILGAKKRLEVANLQEKEFLALSQQQQLERLTRKGQQMLFARGFKRTHFIGPPRIRQPLDVQVCRVKGSTCQQVVLHARQSLAQKTFQNLDSWSWLLLPPNRGHYRAVSTVAVAASKKKITNGSLAGWMPRFDRIGDKIFQIAQLGENGKPTHTITVVVIDGVKSMEDFYRRFRDTTRQLDLD